MANNFRLAIGSGRCKDHAVKRPYGMEYLCRGVVARLEKIKSIKFDQLASLPEENYEEELHERQLLQFTTYNHALSDGSRLLVVQGFFPTWKWPTYISLRGVGHIVAEGLIIDKGDTVTEAPENKMWEFR